MLRHFRIGPFWPPIVRACCGQRVSKHSISCPSYPISTQTLHLPTAATVHFPTPSDRPTCILQYCKSPPFPDLSSVFLGCGTKEYSATRDHVRHDVDTLLLNYYRQAAHILQDKGLKGDRLTFQVR